MGKTEGRQFCFNFLFVIYRAAKYIKYNASEKKKYSPAAKRKCMKERNALSPNLLSRSR
jgi:hypothetical protein